MSEARIRTLSSFFTVVLLLVSVGSSGCSGSGRARYDSPEDAYRKGVELYERGKYSRAIEYLQGVFDFGRTSEYAADAQLLLARANANAGDYLLASNEYQRFIQLYRSDPRLPQAEYENAMTFVSRSPSYQLDQTDTERSVTQLQLFMDRYPTSEYVASADSTIKVLREKMARKQYESAGLYERRELYEAAALTYVGLFDRYPDTVWADDALIGAVRNYIEFSRQSVRSKQAERYQLAVDNYDRLAQLFPDSPHTPRARALIQSSSSLANIADN
jgi:outer membrane protein assembly factor BamD